MVVAAETSLTDRILAIHELRGMDDCLKVDLQTYVANLETDGISFAQLLSNLRTEIEADRYPASLAKWMREVSADNEDHTNKELFISGLNEELVRLTKAC